MVDLKSYDLRDIKFKTDQASTEMVAAVLQGLAQNAVRSHACARTETDNACVEMARDSSIMAYQDSQG